MFDFIMKYRPSVGWEELKEMTSKEFDVIAGLINKENKDANDAREKAK